MHPTFPSTAADPRRGWLCCGAGSRLALALVLVFLCLPALRAEAIPDMETSLEDQEPLHRYQGLSLFGYLGAGVGIDNNVFLTHSDRKIGMYAFIIPGIRAKRDEDNNHVSLQFDYQMRGRRYVGEGNVARASHIEQQVLMYAGWKPTKTIELKFIENAAYLVDPVAADIPRQERFENELSAQAIYRARTTDFKTTAGLNLMRFSDANFRILDRDQFFIHTWAIYHDLGPRANLIGRYKFDYFNNRANSLSDIVVHSLLAGVSSPLGENKGWVYGVDLGLSFMSVVANRAATTGSRDITGFVMEASANYSKEEEKRSYLTFRLRNEYAPSTSSGATFSNSIVFYTEGSYAVNKAIAVGGSFQQIWVQQLNSPGDVARLKISAFGTYHRIRNLSFFGRIEFVQRFGHFKFDRYDDLRLLGGASYVF